MKRRRRASDAERSAKASSIWPSIAFSAPPSRPISVVPPSGSTRRERSPAPIAAAVSSMRRSGRRLAVISQSPSSRALAITAQATSSMISLSWSSVVSVSLSGTPRISVASAMGAERASRRKRVPPALRMHRRAARPAVGGRPEALGEARRGRGLARARERALDGVGSVAGPDLDVHAGCQHAELREELNPLARRGRPRPRPEAAAREGARDAVRARVERAVDAIEERRAQRRVGRDVGGQEPDGRDDREHDEQARAQRQPAYRRSDAPAAAPPRRHELYRSGSRST